MKKALVFLLVFATLLSLCACGGSGDREGVQTESTADQGAVQTESTSATEQSDGQQDEVIDTLHEHVYTPVITAPTCTDDGFTTYTCTCGDHYVSDKVTAAGHIFGQWQTTLAPTEETTGTSERKCSVCNLTETRVLGKLIPNHVHSYATKVTGEATCTKEGSKTLTCVCGESYTESVAKLPHSYKSTVVNPDCVNGGYTTHSCSQCSDAYVDTYTKALGHDYVEKVTPSTCSSTGQKKSTCSRCGSSHTEKLPKGDHSYAAATCTQAKRCTVCGKTEGTSLGHSYSGGSCTRCKVKDPNQQAGPTTFTATIRSDKGKLIQGVTVKVYVNDTLVGAGTTDNKGVSKLNLTSSGSSYRVVLSDIPEAYEGKESYTFSSTTVNINLTTVPVLDPNDHSNAQYKVGDTMADFTLTDTDGNTYTLSELRKSKKLIILDFWYVACAPCKKEFPYFEKAMELYGDDIILLALNNTDSEASIKQLREQLAQDPETKVTFPMIKDTLGITQGFEVQAYPVTAFIDSDGKVVSIHENAFESEDAFLAKIQQYLR